MCFLGCGFVESELAVEVQCYGLALRFMMAVSWSCGMSRSCSVRPCATSQTGCRFGPAPNQSVGALLRRFSVIGIISFRPSAVHLGLLCGPAFVCSGGQGAAGSRRRVDKPEEEWTNTRRRRGPMAWVSTPRSLRAIRFLFWSGEFTKIKRNLRQMTPN